MQRTSEARAEVSRLRLEIAENSAVKALEEKVAALEAEPHGASRASARR